MCRELISQNGRIDEEIIERTAAARKLLNSIKNSFLGSREMLNKKREKSFVWPPHLRSIDHSKTEEKLKRLLRKIEKKTAKEMIFKQILNTKTNIIHDGRKLIKMVRFYKNMQEERKTRKV